MKLNPDNTIDKVIFIWQTEDLLRAHQFDLNQMEALWKGESDEDSDDIKLYLEQLSSEMKAEGVEEKGHLKRGVEQIASLEEKLLTLEDSEKYGIFKEPMDQISALWNKQNGREKSHVFNSFEILYFYYLKKMQGGETDEHIEQLGQVSGQFLKWLEEA